MKTHKQEINKSATRFVVVAGGVISGVGKGVATASIGKILQQHGYSVTIIKIDPYINYDAGTLRPTEHGEVWVTEDGGEIDQDLGTYERFLNIDIPKKNNITTGQIYKAVIDRERAGFYLGQTVQFIPHITDEIIARIKGAAYGFDIALIEIGGTVGDHENVPFLYAIKALERELGADHMAYVLVTYLPVPGHIDEMKTKPTQQAIRLLGEQGILPDFIICRSAVAIDSVRKKKIEEFAHIASDCVIAAPDVSSVYEIPLLFEEQNFGEKILQQLHILSQRTPDWSEWKKLVGVITNKSKKSITIGIVGKYLEVGAHSLTDSYLSIYHALVHAGAHQGCAVSVVWLNAHHFDSNESENFARLANVDGILVPGGFGAQGVEGKINVIEYARTHNIPYLGICYGMQLAVVEFARNVCGIRDAHTTEVALDTRHPVVTLLDSQIDALSDNRYGGTMRLGGYLCVIKQNSVVHELYTAARRDTLQASVDYLVSERHRHRYEINPAYIDQLTQKGLIFSGYHQRADGMKLMEFIELPNHPFFVAAQAHPEFKSRLAAPNPLFYGFVQASMRK